MTKNHPDINNCCLQAVNHQCRHGKGWNRKEMKPLSEACCNGRLKVCKVCGDRGTCARMATLGLLPGSEIELLCASGGRQCMVKLNGGTISLDCLTAKNIFVSPA